MRHLSSRELELTSHFLCKSKRRLCWKIPADQQLLIHSDQLVWQQQPKVPVHLPSIASNHLPDPHWFSPVGFCVSFCHLPFSFFSCYFTLTCWLTSSPCGPAIALMFCSLSLVFSCNLCKVNHLCTQAYLFLSIPAFCVYIKKKMPITLLFMWCFQSN